MKPKELIVQTITVITIIALVILVFIAGHNYQLFLEQKKAQIRAVEYKKAGVLIEGSE